MHRYQDIIETLATGVIVQFDEEVSMRIAWLGIADNNVSDPNTAGMVRTNKVEVLLSAPSADVQEWTRGLEPKNGGTVFPSEVLPPAFTTGRVARVIPPRLSPPALDAWTGICVLP